MEMKWGKGIPRAARHFEEHVLPSVNEMEGTALERLAAEWLGSFEVFDFVQKSVELRWQDDRQLEIDVVGETEDPLDGEKYLALCSCKRNSGKHNLQKTADEFSQYLSRRKEQGSTWDPDKVKRYLFSPTWPQNALQDDEFQRFGFRSMARSLGFEAEPWPTLPAPEPVSKTKVPPDRMDARQPEIKLENDPDWEGPEIGL